MAQRSSTSGRGHGPAWTITLLATWVAAAPPAWGQAPTDTVPGSGAEEPVPENASAGEQAAPAAAAAAEPVQVDTIVVTGSRIKKADFAFSNPVVTIDAATIRDSGAVNVADYLKTIPALAGSLDSNDASGDKAGIGGTGLEELNLRNLGTNRTLVLVDGRRHVAGEPGSAAVDVDTIPSALIDNVEVSLGGASAIYGADGVSGVVNFIMKRNYEGVDVNVQGGTSHLNDANNWLGSVVAGHNFADGALNLTGALEYSRSDRLSHADRPELGATSFHDNPRDHHDNPDLPDEIPLADVRFFDSARSGGVNTRSNREGASLLPNFAGDGSRWDRGSFVPPFYQQGGDGTLESDYIGDLLPKEERYTLNTFLTWQMAEPVRMFGDFKVSHSHAYSLSQPSFDYYLNVDYDNPFVPRRILRTARANDDSPILVTRDNFDLGLRGESINRDTYRGVVGFDGPITDTMRYEVSVVYGQTDVRNHILNNRLNDRFAAAIDAVTDPATGNVVCRSNLQPDHAPSTLASEQADGGFNVFTPRPGTWAGSFTPGPDSGCVPINLFKDGGISPEAARWINATTTDRARIDQTVFQAFISGDSTALAVPGAGPLGYSFGVERRIEGSEAFPSQEDQTGLTFGNIAAPSNGRFGVSEAFAEVNVPLLADRPFAQYLGVDGAIRLSDYSTVHHTRTWKAGGIWSPVKDLSFRGTRAKATRAPNISELFDPDGQTFEFIDDPCDKAHVDEGSQFRVANCRALLKSLGVQDPGRYRDPNSASIAGSEHGNPALEEEDAVTNTVGFVLQPRFLHGLSLSLDYYNIKLRNAINIATAQDEANACVDAPMLDNEFCNLVVRQQGTGGIKNFTEQPLNVAQFKTRGYDFNLNYRFDPRRYGVAGDYGIYTLKLVGNKLQELTFVNLPGADPDIDRDEEDKPRWQAALDLTWDYRVVHASYGLNYFDRTLRFTNQQVSSNPDIADSRYIKYHSKLTHDLSARVEVLPGLTAYAGVDNIGNQKPDVGETFYPVSAVGRAYFAGMELEGTPF